MKKNEDDGNTHIDLRPVSLRYLGALNLLRSGDQSIMWCPLHASQNHSLEQLHRLEPVSLPDVVTFCPNNIFDRRVCTKLSKIGTGVYFVGFEDTTEVSFMGNDDSNRLFGIRSC